jgi:hypothetical protein
MNNKIYESHIKHLNQKLGWIYGPAPDDGLRYWTAAKDGTVYILTSDHDADMDWTYEDGEKIGYEVIAYKALPVPLFKV